MKRGEANDTARCAALVAAVGILLGGCADPPKQAEMGLAQTAITNGARDIGNSKRWAVALD
jgi:hypothetical protein